MVVDTTMGQQFAVQLTGVVATIVYTAIVTAIIFFVIKAVVGLRVDEDQETEGLDIVSHGERGYDI